MNGHYRQNWEANDKKGNKGRVLAGLTLVIVGILLLLKATQTITFPEWFFTWPMLLIVVGLISGMKHGFRGPFWLILLLVGGFALADRIDPEMNLDRFIWPLVFISIGLIFILRPKSNKQWRQCGPPYPARPVSGENEAEEEFIADKRDFIDVTAVFGGVKKNILSKNFKGGELVSIMGGSEIDLTQADFKGRITIDTTNIFGGTKIIVPSNWDVQSDLTAIFGGVDDKRPVTQIQPDPEKVLILDGLCLFGGIEIRSF